MSPGCFSKVYCLKWQSHKGHSFQELLSALAMKGVPLLLCPTLSPTRDRVSWHSLPRECHLHQVLHHCFPRPMISHEGLEPTRTLPSTPHFADLDSGEGQHLVARQGITPFLINWERAWTWTFMSLVESQALQSAGSIGFLTSELMIFLAPVKQTIRS